MFLASGFWDPPVCPAGASVQLSCMSWEGGVGDPHRSLARGEPCTHWAFLLGPRLAGLPLRGLRCGRGRHITKIILVSMSTNLRPDATLHTSRAWALCWEPPGHRTRCGLPLYYLSNPTYLAIFLRGLGLLGLFDNATFTLAEQSSSSCYFASSLKFPINTYPSAFIVSLYDAAG